MNSIVPLAVIIPVRNEAQNIRACLASVAWAEQVFVVDSQSEDGTGVDRTRAHERNRGPLDDPRRTANRYLKRIRYGNRKPLLHPDTGRRPRFLTADQVTKLTSAKTLKDP